MNHFVSLGFTEGWTMTKVKMLLNIVSTRTSELSENSGRIARPTVEDLALPWTKTCMRKVGLMPECVDLLTWVLRRALPETSKRAPVLETHLGAQTQRASPTRNAMNELNSNDLYIPTRKNSPRRTSRLAVMLLSFENHVAGSSAGTLPWIRSS